MTRDEGMLMNRVLKIDKTDQNIDLAFDPRISIAGVK